jgi:error-prone DNA polymerase
VTGKLQRQGIVIHVITETIEDLSPQLDALGDPAGADAPGQVREHVPKLRRHPREQARVLFPSRDFR